MNDQEILPACLYSLGREIGEGGYSTVNICKHRESGIHFAVKIMSEEDAGTFDQEVCLLKRLQDVKAPFVKMVDLFRAGDKNYIVMDLASGGDMWTWIKTRSYLTEGAMINVIHQLLQALAVCHENGVVHRDVKPENIVIESLQSDEPSKVLLCDFGLALTIGPSGKLPVEGEPGTPGYQAPEIFQESGSFEYGFGVDIWGIGVSAFFMITGDLPFDARFGPEEYLENCDDFPRICCSKAVEIFLRRCLTVDPAQRWTAREALQYHIFDGLPEFTETLEKMESREIAKMRCKTSALPEQMSAEEEEEREEMGEGEERESWEEESDSGSGSSFPMTG
ncbi:kinase-like domain-containing protein [Morchella snyderi]|nr:kinase-like domain-containing protein [Morchella snyderi]